MKLWVVDAFCDDTHRGNPAGVCLLEQWPDDNLLGRIAAEINLSETAFVCRTPEHYQLRWFSPRCEIELCGHATLASAAVIWRENLENPHHPIIFDTRNGVFTVFQTPPLIHLKFPLM
ncbi:MAG: PhzF family phenazine biosynthesis protein, partial [Candidatus Delongbacteria bacterium]|nr:PhzF family phenazine biosynthesis protein [Candidatus Delongbacteria bacterium]